jgi:FkbM family methyltransferase
MLVLIFMLMVCSKRKTIELIMQKLPPGGVLVDMGANIGSISLPVCKQRPDVKAICIEAAERVYGYFDFNVKLNELINCTIINKAHTDNDGAIVNFLVRMKNSVKGR